MSRNIFRRGFDAWSRQLEKNPFRTQVATSTVIAITGDIASQAYFGRHRVAAAQRAGTTSAIGTDAADNSADDDSSVVDLRRTARFGLYRCAHFCVMGPWFNMLERNVRFASPAATVVAKIAVDQLLWTPPSMAVFYAAMAMLEGGSLDDGIARSKAALWPTLQVNWPFWSCAFLLFSVAARCLHPRRRIRTQENAMRLARTRLLR
jgi:hypothetical protein